MATINSPFIVDEIIDGKGMYPGDHIRVVKIVEYNNDFNGETAYGLIYEHEDLDRYRESQFIHNPRTIWEYKG
jgi:hypothetical protein